MLFELGVNVHEPASGGCSTIYRAAQMGSLKCMQRLYEFGCDLNESTENGKKKKEKVVHFKQLRCAHAITF